jgi:lysyl-tRNA synthetase class 2
MEPTHAMSDTAPDKLSIFEIKKAKFLELREQARFADAYEKTHTSAEAQALPEATGGLRLAGRVVGLRTMGKILFAHLYDFSGRIQVCVRKTPENPETFERFVEEVSVGDFIGCAGELFRTKTGELTLAADSFTLLNKCLRTLPDKFHGVEDIETRYRQRYLDIVMSAESRDVFLKRIQVVKELRRFLEVDGFLEVETPVLQTLQSGALARPFHTHHNALDVPLVLRIAPETYLKRCIGAGFDKVYEFARCFRNEGISATHLQDFTMLEFYAGYWNAARMRGFIAEMFRSLIANVFGSTQVTLQGKEIDFAGEWPVFDYCELVKADCGIDVRVESSRERLAAAMAAKGIVVDDAETLSWANLVDALYKKVTRPKLVQPCFIEKYPADMAPLARRNAADPAFVDMFQFLVAGVEIVKAYSELVDPLDQRARFEDQVVARDAGDEETMPLDEEFLTAMEHGFPPICGVGIGIDRLTMVLCGCDNIKDTVLFPLLRPVAHGSVGAQEAMSAPTGENAGTPS